MATSRANGGASAAASRDYLESYLAEDDVLQTARDAGHRLGCTPIGAAGGATLRLLASIIGARAVVEIGTGAGVSGLWLLRGMAPGGVLTTVDVSAEHQRVARATFRAAGVAGPRTRVITGAAADVLPRLTDGVYDLVFADASKSEYADYLTEALRLLRPGGIVAFDNVLWHDRAADPTVHDEDTDAVREVTRAVHDHELLDSAMLGVGDGLLVAVYHPDRG